MQAFASLFEVHSSHNLVWMFSIMYFGGIVLQIAYSLPEQLAYLKARPPGSTGALVLGVWPLPRIEARSFLLTGLIFVALLAIGCSQSRLSPVALLLALPCYFYFFGQILGMSYVARKTNMIPVTILVLLFSPGLTASFSSSTAIWPLMLLKFLLGLVYLAAGIAKLRHTGFRWANGCTMQAALTHHYMCLDVPLALRLARRPALCRFLSTVTLFWELTFWIAVFVPPLDLVYAPLGIAFHLGTQLTMRINYLRYWAVSYFAFVPEWAEKLGAF